MPRSARNLDLFHGASPTQRSRLQPLMPASRPQPQVAHALWLAIHLPQWPLDALQSGERDTSPAAVTDVLNGRSCVQVCNAQAMRLGIAPGMPINAAYALWAQLRTLPRDAAREYWELERLAEWAGSFTPRVSIEAPDGLLLEVKGSVRLFGGVRALAERVLRELRQRGVTARIALTPTPLASLCLARQPLPEGDWICVRALSELPARMASVSLRQLRWSSSVLQTLDSMGVQTIGQCQRLPRDGLARRIGPECVLELDGLLGRAPQVRRRFVPRERFAARCEFEMELTHTQQLECWLQPLLAQLEQFLRTRQAAVQAIKLSFKASRVESARIEPVIVRFAAPVTTQQHIWTVLKERLGRLVLSAPIVALRIGSGALVSVRQDNARLSLPESLGNEAAYANRMEEARLIDLLRARLGTDAVQGLSQVADHRPEYAVSLCAAQVAMRSQSQAPIQAPTFSSARPAWLLPQPQALSVMGSWPQYRGALQFEQGPERIESGWWDGRDVTRDYYIVRASTGQRLWIYRERRPPHAWFLHGVFAG
jgi:protein ImuB